MHKRICGLIENAAGQFFKGFFFEVQLRERVLGLVREGLEGWIVLCAVELRISLNLQAGERNSPPEFTFVPCM